MMTLLNRTNRIDFLWSKYSHVFGEFLSASMEENYLSLLEGTKTRKEIIEECESIIFDGFYCESADIIKTSKFFVNIKCPKCKSKKISFSFYIPDDENIISLLCFKCDTDFSFKLNEEIK